MEFRKMLSNDNSVCKTAKETQMYRTVFWTLWERERVGWFGRMTLNMYNIIYERNHQSKFDAWYWMFGAGALEHVYWCFPFWLTSLCIIGSSFIHLIRTDSNVFFLMAEMSISRWMDKKAALHIHNGVLLYNILIDLRQIFSQFIWKF